MPDRRGGRCSTGRGRQDVHDPEPIIEDQCSEEPQVAEVCPVDEAVGENGHDDELEVPQDEEEADAVQPLPTPNTPTRSEVLDHRVCHVPFRAWCKHCVEGRGQEFGHYSHKKEARGAPVVTFDY